MNGVSVKFEMDTPVAPAAVLQTVHERLCEADSTMAGIVADGRIELYVTSERQHLWSPQLVVDVLPAETGRTGAVLRGRFAPHPHVWALYLAAAAVTAFATLLAVTFAYAQWVVGQSPSALWALPSALLAWLALYAVASLGQRWGAEQVDELRMFLDDGLSVTEREPHSIRPDGVFMRAQPQKI